MGNERKAPKSLSGATSIKELTPDQKRQANTLRGQLEVAPN